MASIKKLKDQMNFSISEVIESVYEWERTTGNKGAEKATSLIDKAIKSFDDLNKKVNDRLVDNRGAHLKGVQKEFATVLSDLKSEVAAL